MVSLASNESSLRMLIERLNWPVRMVRWRAAREYGALLSSKDYSKRALKVYLDWLSSRQFESEIGSALAVLLCTAKNELPSFRAVVGYISKPSILADMMLQSVYGRGKIKGQWEKAHSGEVPPSFRPGKFFLDHKSAHVPPIFGDSLSGLEAKTGLPFMRQWAFEWHCLMESTKSPHSGYPYHFNDLHLNRAGVNGQFSQRQCDVYRSAFLRTLACAVDCWDMPANKADQWALDTLPVNRGLVELDPVDRPPWLSDIPEKCTIAAGSLEPLVRNLIEPGLGQQSMRPVALKIPISADIAEFAALTVLAVLASSDFVPDLNLEHTPLERPLLWTLPDGISLEGPFENRDIATFTSPGITGAAAPLCLDLWPQCSGFWHNDYFQRGIQLPAPYAFQGQVNVACRDNHIEITSGRHSVASWNVWHDRWTPLYAKDGATRCGTLTELHEDEVTKAKDRHGMALGWLVELKVWKRKMEYGEFELKSRREFFRD